MRYGNPLKKSKTVSSLKGHTIEFPGRGSLAKSDLPAPDPKASDELKARYPKIDEDGIVYIYVPPVMRAEVEAVGMQSEADIEEAEEKKGVVKPTDPVELQKAAFDAFDVLVAAAERESFGGNGAPKPAAIEKLLGYPLVTSEIKDLWTKYQAERQAERQK